MDYRDQILVSFAAQNLSARNKNLRFGYSSGEDNKLVITPYRIGFGILNPILVNSKGTILSGDSGLVRELNQEAYKLSAQLEVLHKRGLRVIAPPGFEPGSQAPKACILDR